MTYAKGDWVEHVPYGHTTWIVEVHGDKVELPGLTELVSMDDIWPIATAGHATDMFGARTVYPHTPKIVAEGC